MTAGSIWALLGLFLATPATPANAAGRARYAPGPFATATLFLDSTTHSVTILNENNVALKILPVEYQDLEINHAFYVECRLAPNAGLSRIGVWASRSHRLIPVDVAAYKSYDPAYVELDIDTAYLENRTDGRVLNDHKINIEFYAQP